MDNVPVKGMQLNDSRAKLRPNERGSVMIMTAILMAGIVLAIGLCIDIARLYMVRTELQNAADAAALAAARELDSGAGGIQDAVLRATSIINTYGFNDAAVNVQAVNVEFAINLNGTYVSAGEADDNPTVYRFVRVTTNSVTMPMLFAARVLGANRTESKSAVAGMSVGLNTICDFFPFAVALDDSDPTDGVDEDDNPIFTLPAPNTPMTLNFVQGTGNTMTLRHRDYVILEVPEITGVGVPETVRLAAGLTSICATLDENIDFHATPSSNVNNGPRNIADGTNTRFDIYPGPPGGAPGGGPGGGPGGDTGGGPGGGGPGQLNPTEFPPDTNVADNISYQQYIDRTSVQAPPNHPPGRDQRRILVVPVVKPGTYTGTPVSAPTIKFAAFFLKRPVEVDNPCSNALDGCARFEVEFIDERLVIGRGSFVPGGGTSSLTLPVLFK